MGRSVIERLPSRDQQEVARRQGSPYTGKLSARPAGKPGDFFVKGEFATIPSRHLLPAHLILRRLSMRFLRHDGIYRSDVVQTKTKPWAQTEPPPAGRPRAQVKERVERATLFSSSAMSSGRLFLEQVGRHQSPSPLHRQSQNNRHSPVTQAKGDISTLPGGRHFYFALTGEIDRLRDGWNGCSIR